MGMGLLSCEDYLFCPRDCSICSTCLSLSGCEAPQNFLQQSGISKRIWVYIALVLLFILILAIALYHNRRKSKEENDLKESLMAKDKGKEVYSPPPPVDKGDKTEKIEPFDHPALHRQPSADKAAALAAWGMATQSKDEGDENDSDSDDSGDSRTARTFDETTLHTSDDSTVQALTTKDC